MVMRSLAWLFTALTATPAIASELPPMTWAEYHACKYNADQTSDSVAEWTSRWNAWMNESGRDDYSAAVLSPLYRSPPATIDMLWVGATSSNEAMAIGQSQWRNSDIFATWPATDCSISMLATQYPVGSPIPVDVMTDEMVIAYWYCSLEDGATIQDVYVAHSATMKAGAEAGAVQESRIILPRQGVPAQFEQYDFMVSYIHPSMAQWGRNVDQVWLAGLVAEEQELAAQVFQCGSPVVYVGNIIRRAQ